MAKFKRFREWRFRHLALHRIPGTGTNLLKHDANSGTTWRLFTTNPDGRVRGTYTIEAGPGRRIVIHLNPPKKKS